jgi:hypothetical protein
MSVLPKEVYEHLEALFIENRRLLALSFEQRQHAQTAKNATQELRRKRSALLGELRDIEVQLAYAPVDARALRLQQRSLKQLADEVKEDLNEESRAFKAAEAESHALYIKAKDAEVVYRRLKAEYGPRLLSFER